MLFPKVFVLLLFGYTLAYDCPVTTPLGKILGSKLTTRLGKTIYAFRGIRYAQAPINELRFQPPVAVEKWEGVYNATVDGPVCPQPTDDPVSEDCLFLNVYTTKPPHDGNYLKRPVIIYLHAGGFYSVTGRSNWMGPQYFMDQDIVLVTINYRLGSLGFLSLGKAVPGNNGFRDQVMAMKWVRDNIAAFGGDPASVTLYGYSAGAWSTTLHMVSPMSRGLFHKAIIGSGSSLVLFPLRRTQLPLAKKQARVVGCPDTTPQEILQCLKAKPAQELGNSLPQFDNFGRDPLWHWTSVIEEDYGQERFLHEDPIKLFQSGNFQKIPVVLGITRHEFANRAFPLVANKSLLRRLNDHFETFAPICFAYERDTERSKEVSRAVRRFYLGNQTLSDASRPAIAKIYADSLTGFPVDRTADLIAAKNSESIYYYQFNYRGRYTHFYRPESNGTVPYGVVHHDDLIYAFYIRPLFPFFDQTYPEAEMVDKLTSLWTNFAKTGKPIPTPSWKFDNVQWDTFNPNTRKYLEIGNTMVVKENMYGERYDFWRKLYPLSLHV